MVVLPDAHPIMIAPNPLSAKLAVHPMATPPEIYIV